MLYKQKIYPITFTGSAQALLASGTLDQRFVTFASVEAMSSNAARCFIGESDVSSTKYSTSLAANDQAVIGGPELSEFKQTKHGKVDLAKIFIIGTAAQGAMLTVFVPDEG